MREEKGREEAKEEEDEDSVTDASGEKTISLCSSVIVSQVEEQLLESGVHLKPV